MLHLVTHGTDSSKMAYLNAPVKNLATRPWSGFKDKLVAMREFLATLPPDDVVCFVDGYDVTCFFDNTEVLEKFKPGGQCGIDKEGSPVFYERTGMSYVRRSVLLSRTCRARARARRVSASLTAEPGTFLA